jgi:hypothetical protein
MVFYMENSKIMAGYWNTRIPSRQARHEILVTDQNYQARIVSRYNTVVCWANCTL